MPEAPGPTTAGASSRRRLAVRLTQDALRQVRAGHPWVYDRSIRSISHDGAPGDLAVVFDDDRRFVAIGLWDPASPIRLRVVHCGRPTPIDRGLWRGRLVAALERRAPLLATAGTDDETDAYRCVHGENDGLPGLVIDRYASTYVVKLDTAAWVPHLADVLGELVELVHPTSVVLRTSRSVRPDELHGLHDGVTLVGPEGAGPVRFREHGLSFEADVVHGQKTGHFLDQRDNRRRVAQLAAGQRVLDVFSCTGGFSVYAAGGGAVEVHSVDASPGAIATAQRNMDLNRHRPEIAACRHLTTVGDAFEVMARLARAGERFGIVVIDPPSFAPNAASVRRALTAYARLTELGLRLTRLGGTLVQASCSSRVGLADFARTVHAAASAAGYQVRELARTEHPLDHPVGFPEGSYLKALFLQVVAEPPRSTRRVR